eukprot:1999859-Amphidinium_carterae.1
MDAQRVDRKSVCDARTSKGLEAHHLRVPLHSSLWVGCFCSASWIFKSRSTWLKGAAGLWNGFSIKALARTNLTETREGGLVLRICFLCVLHSLFSKPRGCTQKPPRISMFCDGA